MLETSHLFICVLSAQVPSAWLPAELTTMLLFKLDIRPGVGAEGLCSFPLMRIDWAEDGGTEKLSLHGHWEACHYFFVRVSVSALPSGVWCIMRSRRPGIRCRKACRFMDKEYLARNGCIHSLSSYTKGCFHHTTSQVMGLKISQDAYFHPFSLRWHTFLSTLQSFLTNARVFLKIL